jgi:hypothetical protein
MSDVPRLPTPKAECVNERAVKGGFNDVAEEVSDLFDKGPFNSQSILQPPATYTNY